MMSVIVSIYSYNHLVTKLYESIGFQVGKRLETYEKDV
jgi:ribosomal protein S18 acetylase RimI-like enzyme